MQFLETSAKNATNVEQAFMTMTSEIKNRYDLVYNVEPPYLLLTCPVLKSLCCWQVVCRAP